MKGITILLVSLLVIMMPIGVQAKEEEKIEAVLSFYLTEQDRFVYEVKVSDGGCLYDGSQRITNGIIAYELSVGQKKEFQMEANEGYEVKRIEINGVEQNLEAKEIEIHGVSATSVLEVRYGRIEEEKIPEKGKQDITENVYPPIEQGKEERKIPSTADLMKISAYISVLVIVIGVFYISKRGINTARHVEDIEIKEEKKDEK